MARCGAGAQRESLLRVLDGRRRDLLEAHRPPLLEDGEGGVQRAGRHCRVEAFASSVLPRDRYQSTFTAFGAQPCPTMEVTFLSFCG